MNLKNQHPRDKAVSFISLFKGSEGTVTSMSLAEGGELKPHISKIPAILVCITGQVVYATEGNKEILNSGDYSEIEPMVEHWVIGIENSQLLLIK